jgi:hypothetical protein
MELFHYWWSRAIHVQSLDAYISGLMSTILHSLSVRWAHKESSQSGAIVLGLEYLPVVEPSKPITDEGNCHPVDQGEMTDTESVAVEVGDDDRDVTAHGNRSRCHACLRLRTSQNRCVPLQEPLDCRWVTVYIAYPFATKWSTMSRCVLTIGRCVCSFLSVHCNNMSVRRLLYPTFQNSWISRRPLGSRLEMARGVASCVVIGALYCAL